MPTSDPRVIEAGCAEIIRIQPKRVLDIGIGYGKWGALTREYTDIWKERFFKDEWLTDIVGIEVYEKYRNPIWGVYDTVFIGEASDMVKELIALEDGFDLGIMMDVLEHFPKAKGKEFITNVLKICDRFMVSWCNSEQKNVRENKHEDHLSTWIVSDFEKMGVLDKIIKNEQHHLGAWGIVLLKRDT